MGPAKLQKAEKLGIKILSEAEFMTLIAAADRVENIEVVESKAQEQPASNKPIQGTLF
jgi:BRCT domain type II-containing protein